MTTQVPHMPLLWLVSTQLLNTRLIRKLLHHKPQCVRALQPINKYQPAFCALCRAAFEGRINEMLQIARTWSAEKRTQFDPQGNTVSSFCTLSSDHDA